MSRRLGRFTQMVLDSLVEGDRQGKLDVKNFTLQDVRNLRNWYKDTRNLSPMLANMVTAGRLKRIVPNKTRPMRYELTRNGRSNPVIGVKSIYREKKANTSTKIELTIVTPLDKLPRIVEAIIPVGIGDLDFIVLDKD